MPPFLRKLATPSKRNPSPRGGRSLFHKKAAKRPWRLCWDPQNGPPPRHAKTSSTHLSPGGLPCLAVCGHKPGVQPFQLGDVPNHVPTNRRVCLGFRGQASSLYKHRTRGTLKNKHEIAWMFWTPPNILEARAGQGEIWGENTCGQVLLSDLPIALCTFCDLST